MADIESGPVSNITQIGTRIHNDLQLRNAIATHPSESVGVFRDSAIFPQDMGKNWKDLGVISTSVIYSMTYLGNGIVVFGDSVGHIFRSTDFGATWTDLGVILPNP